MPSLKNGTMHFVTEKLPRKEYLTNIGISIKLILNSIFALMKKQ
ncbi:hypothetical protein CLV32_0055 [Pedobacter duraquae]|uniref:Uncharacterized protein n=1 Tax=Pedobacter duraquae TaxID=425511 RepID=A0A4R6ING8_9SPHI|nr:hypothetical protein CLV32_0055 [Pedobacter duraquae]